MVRNLPGAIVDETGIDVLDRVGDSRVQSLFARSRDAGKKRLTYELMGKGERALGSLGAGDDYFHQLRFLDHGEKFVNINLADLSQESKAETPPDHRGGCQNPLFVLVEPRETALDDQAHVFRNVNLVDLDVFAELPSLIEDFPLFNQMPVHFLDEERIALAFLEDEV